MRERQLNELFNKLLLLLIFLHTTSRIGKRVYHASYPIYKHPSLAGRRQKTFRRSDTYDALRRAVKVAFSLNPLPNAIIATGDIAEDGSLGAYLAFKSIFESVNVPIVAVPGNHDDLASMRSAFSDSNVDVATFISWEHWDGIFINSTVSQKSYGNIDKATLLDIEQMLKQSSHRPVMISLHHSPLSGCPSSGCQLQNGDELLNRLSHYKNVKLLVSGHLHQEFEKDYGHFKVLTSPSTFAQGRHSHPAANVDFEDFWASHSLDIAKQGFRV